MSEWFEVTGDKAPNRENHVQLPGMYTRRSIYLLCVEDLKKKSEEFAIVKFDMFMRVWNACFPNVKITRWLNVSFSLGSLLYISPLAICW